MILPVPERIDFVIRVYFLVSGLHLGQDLLGRVVAGVTTIREDEDRGEFVVVFSSLDEFETLVDGLQ